ncbi:tyrosine-protein kinase receptor Tie-1 isoform X2 [Astatotilapia calliptera]|uniref:Tyrosine-protein kinase receptor Tie-1 n=1 Tax=Astatotilapia calliptera TaxID=8154 RepID=A0A3P8N834_ASTCA|nr:tyrosine-protein kinase receptor Tie-1 isoform X2 [Astatotilapia calliptera]
MRITNTKMILWVFALCFFTLSDAVIDLTMFSAAMIRTPENFSISCINGERNSAQAKLDIKKDNKILMFSSVPQYKMHKSGNKMVVARDFSRLENIGIFYCESSQDFPPVEKITMINNLDNDFVPNSLTLLANVGETVHLTMHLLNPQRRDVTWKYNGNYYYMTHWIDMFNETVELTVENVKLDNQGIYSASYVGDTPLNGAWMRLIVRGCPSQKWGPNCIRDCQECLNGGVCHEVNGDCICPPGFMGTHCETACREGMFGQNCQETCGSKLNCKGLRFCLPDPYGCSCASGWFGSHCENACHNGMYGPDCKFSCKCQNGGVCSRFSGCQCPRGWRGQHCDRSDWAPQILDLDRHLELNLNSKAMILCSATGNPLPSHNSIELRKLDSTVLKASRTVMDSNRSTAEFDIPNLSAEQEGLWECRVSTDGGQDSREFTLTVKVPPMPITAPKLLEKRSKQLLVMPVYTSVGDGPIISIRVLYKPVENKNEDLWSSIIVYSDKEPITLMNLEPSTRYYVRVQLSRPGEGGEGDPGPQAIMETDCPGPSSPLNVKAVPLSMSAIQVKWQPPDDPNGGILKYIIEYQPVGQVSPHPWVDTDDGNKTTKDVTALNGSTVYQFRVRAFSKVPGEWSNYVQAKTQGDEKASPTFTPTTLDVIGQPTDSYQLLIAVVGSVTVTCVTILLALLALFFIRKTLLNRRRTFTYQSGSGEETILQFNSGTLTLTRRPKPTPEPLTYPILEWENIKFEDVIGEGNFGQVIKAMIKKDGNKMSAAIKMLKEFASENDHRDFAGELEVLCKLGQHPNIINLIGACENRGYLYIAIEYAPYGNLLDFLRKSRVLETDPAFAKEHGTASTLTSQQLLQFAVDVANGMHYLSDKQFIHRDLAARNVLVGDNLVAKIADFGLSRGEEVYVKKTMGRLPVRWMAIESLNYSVYTTKSDVWSFGVLLWEIVSLGGTPYCGMTCAELYEKLPQGYRMEKPKNCDDEVYELMRQCWRDRPYERPPFSQISLQLNRMQEARKAYVNMALFENFTYAGIDATAEEA